MSFEPSDQQRQAIAAINRWRSSGARGQQVFRLFGYAGTGKEQPFTSLVQTPHGSRQIGDLEPGDLVIGRDGKPTRVLGVYPQGPKPVYRVTFRDGAVARCGADHLWFVKTQKWARPVTTKFLIGVGVKNRQGDYRFQIPLCEPVSYANPTPPFDPYMMGALIGDGYLTGTVVALCCPEGKDGKGEIVEWVRDALPDDMEIRSDYAPTCPRHILCQKKIGGKRNELKRHIDKVGLSVTSTDRFIPHEYLRAPVAERLALLRGLMDTDGSITHNRVRFSTKSKKLASDIRTLVQSLGGTAILLSYDRGDKGIEYNVKIKMLTNPFRMSRKALQWRPSRKNPPSRFIVSIEEEGVIEEQICIKVAAPDSLYLTDEFVVTHNTTLAQTIANTVGGTVAYGAFTGKAASVMRKKGCFGAKTIHSMIYEPHEDEETGETSFGLNHESEIRDAKLIIIDECSMVGEDLGKDLMSFGVPILVIGDPAQLPPVGGAGYFIGKEPDFLLTEIHRQAMENPIIRLSVDVREGRRLEHGDYGLVRVIDRTQLDPKDVTGADMVLVGKNATRVAYNARIRTLLGRADKYPTEGDKLVCLQNDREKGLLNGTLWTVRKRKRAKGRHIGMVVEGEDDGKTISVRVLENFFDGTEAKLDWKEKKGSEQMTYGYALTVHKSQGSQWNNVCLFDDSYIFREDRAKHLYTAITRAAETLTVVRPRD